MKRIAFLSGLCIAGVLVCLAASAERLRSPWDSLRITASDAPCTCPAPPTFSKTLEKLEGYYTDKQYSLTDPKKLAAFNEATGGPTHLGQYATNAADAWLSKGSRNAAACVYSLLSAAAQADAWDGKMPDNNGVYLQNWMLSGTAIAYLKVRNAGMGTPAEDAAIQNWFRLLAARVLEYFNMQSGRPGSDAWNNHYYWAGLAVAAEGVADNDQDAFIQGLATYRRGVGAILPDGSLTAEMARGQRALHYQLYALGPLVMLAELGEDNGIEMYGADDGAMLRLVRFNVAAMKDPSIIARRTGVAQDITQPYSGLEIGWAVPWVERFPNPQLSGWIARAPWVRFWQWGGAPPDVTLATAASAAEVVFRAQLRDRAQAAFAIQFPASHAQSAAFFGSWCVEGDLTWHASITDERNYILVTNEKGDKSTGQAQGPGVLIAPGWGSATGTLTRDHSQIDWSNGTYWSRCSTGAAPSRTNLAGTWYPLGVLQKCFIRQEGDTLQLDNGQGATGTGHIDATGRLVSDWSGNRIVGVVTADGNHINWDNQTYWTRAAVYESRKN
jgi:poly(beta-D-mannuronate) lyase